MQKYFSQNLNMQIPQDPSHIDISDVSSLDFEIKKLSKHYNVERKEKILNFIEDKPELVGYLDKITHITNKYFPKHFKTITFCEDPEFEELNDISIYIHTTESQYSNDWKKYDELETEILTMNEFSSKIKRLISISLWFI